MSRIAAAALAAFLLLVLGAFLFGGPVVDYWRQRTADSEAREELATDDAEARGLEAQGTRDLTAAAEELARTADTLRSQTHVVEIRSRADPAVAAAGRLPPDELARMRAHDRLLLDAGLEARDDGDPAQARAGGQGARGLQGDAP